MQVTLTLKTILSWADHPLNPEANLREWAPTLNPYCWRQCCWVDCRNRRNVDRWLSWRRIWRFVRRSCRNRRCVMKVKDSCPLQKKIEVNFESCHLYHKGVWIKVLDQRYLIVFLKSSLMFGKTISYGIYRISLSLKNN